MIKSSRIHGRNLRWTIGLKNKRPKSERYQIIPNPNIIKHPRQTGKIIKPIKLTVHCLNKTIRSHLPIIPALSKHLRCGLHGKPDGFGLQGISHSSHAHISITMVFICSIVFIYIYTHAYTCWYGFHAKLNHTSLHALKTLQHSSP